MALGVLGVDLRLIGREDLEALHLLSIAAVGAAVLDDERLKGLHQR